MAPAAILDTVSVRYGRTSVLQDVSATFPRGAVGLLGPNGAGKSTVIKALLGLVAPSAGRIRVLDTDVAAAPVDLRGRIGYMPESDAHIPGMTAAAFVAYCGELAGLPRADAMQRAHEVLYSVGLGEARYRNVETFSSGLQQRVKLAQALVHDPDLLLLDEPANGMDPRGRDEMLELIRDIAQNKGVSVILSSHVLPDVERTCDHVVVLDRGRVATQGAMAALKARGGRVFELRVKADAGQAERFVSVLQAAGLDCTAAEGETMRVLVPEDREARCLFELADRQGLQVRHLKPSAATLDDVFAEALHADSRAGLPPV